MRRGREARAARLALLAGAVLLLPAGAPRAASSGPDPALTGVPAGGGFAAEGSCTACHTGAPANPDAAGRIALEGAPERYEPGRRYALALRVSHPDPSRTRWGFQLTAVDAASFGPAGELVVTDPVATQRVEGGPGGRHYLEQSADGTGIGEAGGMRWTFAWVAPEDGADVAFYATANAANTDGSDQGDWIFTPSPEPLALVRGPGAGSREEE